MKKILILGAASAIAQETARCFSEEKASFYLAARDEAKLEVVKQDLLTRGASGVETRKADLADTSCHEELVRTAEKVLGGIDVVLIAYGKLSEQAACEKDYALTAADMKTNFLSVVSFLTILANLFIPIGGQTIAVISSVAGDRGRASNYVYGSAKGALSLYLQGLRARLAACRVHVLTVKPGFVATPMTANLPKNILFTSPKEAGKGIYQAIRKKKNTVYVPWFWFWIMLVIKMIPESFFIKLKSELLQNCRRP
ncbi:MAG: short-chain dehydrogenase [Omnitrophica bacterium GWA2_52_8]|nr:MAG: short-chain dehydrogenase [Omnitrophica bacterium GWA2_52_8]